MEREGGECVRSAGLGKHHVLRVRGKWVGKGRAVEWSRVGKGWEES